MASTPGRFRRTMGGAYDEIDLEDMDWNSELGAFTYQCPCGDLFQITPEELRAGEEVGRVRRARWSSRWFTTQTS